MTTPGKQFIWQDGKFYGNVLDEHAESALSSLQRDFPQFTWTLTPITDETRAQANADLGR